MFLLISINLDYNVIRTKHKYSILHIFFTAVVVGGIDMMTQSLALAKKPHIIIGKVYFIL